MRCMEIHVDKLTNIWRSTFTVKQEKILVSFFVLYAGQLVVDSVIMLHGPLCLSSPRCIMWVPATYCWGVTLRWISIPSRGGVAILLDMPHAKETGISSVRLGLWFLSYLTLFNLLFFTVPHVTDFSLGAATFSIYFIIFYLFIHYLFFYFLFFNFYLRRLVWPAEISFKKV